MKFKVQYVACNDEAKNEKTKKEAMKFCESFLKKDGQEGEIKWEHGIVEPISIYEAMKNAILGTSRRYVQGELVKKGE